jgi:hypothetical protein
VKRAGWLAEVLRAAGCEVVEHAGWRDRGRDFTDLRAVVLHHDASPHGNSPGVPGFMLREMAAGRPGAQLWVSRHGSWHVLAAGVAFHAGAVLAGKPGNGNALGVETDHTVGEAWPPAQIASVRKGTAAILRHLKVSPAVGLEFHRTICSPPGRKVDPDGLDLAAERAAVADLMAHREEDDLFTDDDRRRLEKVEQQVIGLDWFLVPDDDPDTPQDERQPTSKGELGKYLREMVHLTRGLQQRDPQVIAAAIPQDFAQQVIDALYARIGGQK